MGLLDRFKSNEIENYSEAFKKFYEKGKIKKAKKLLEDWEKEEKDDYNFYFAKSLILFDTISKSHLDSSQLKDAVDSMKELNKKAKELSPYDSYFDKTNIKDIDYWFYRTNEQAIAGLDLILMNL